MDIITVYSQEEFYSIPTDREIAIHIAFGTKNSPAVVDRRFPIPVYVYHDYYVVAKNDSYVIAKNKSHVEAHDESKIAGMGYSTITAKDDSCVDAYGHCCVEAYDYSFINCFDSADVFSYDSAWVFASRRHDGVVISKGKYKEVHRPDTINQFMDYFKIERNGRKAILYKAVRRKENHYISIHDPSFEYRIGEIKEEKCDTDVNTINSYGIHVSTLDWATYWRRNDPDLAILEIETDIEDIVMPTQTVGDVRTSKIKVLREVPLQ